VESTGEALLKRIATGEVDFGVSPLWQPTESLKARLLLKDALGILCSKTHSLSHKKDFVTWAELSGHRVILPPRNLGVRQFIDHDTRVSKLLPAPAYEVFGASATISLVASGVGVAVLPGMALGPSLQADLTFKPLKEPRKLREIHYVRSDRRPLTHAAELVSDLMLKEVRKLPFGDSLIPAPRLLAS
jgi:DNA-binding transcriptional LysR family regulator